MQAGCADSGMNLDTQDALCWWMETTSMDRKRRTRNNIVWNPANAKPTRNLIQHRSWLSSYAHSHFARVPVDLDQEVGDSKKSVPPSGRLRRKLAWNFIVVTIFARLLSGSPTD